MVLGGLVCMDGVPIPEPVQCHPCKYLKIFIVAHSSILNCTFKAKVFDPRALDLPYFILAALFLVTILHSLSAVARPQIQLVLATLKVMLFGALTWTSNSLVNAILTESQAALLGSIPLDV